MIHYVLIIIIVITIAYVFDRISSSKKSESIMIPASGNFHWSIYIRSNGQIYKELEGDDLGRIGYHIYKNLGQSLDAQTIYIRDNSTNDFLRIDKDYESECMIGVDHPERGHIGYLPFTRVSSI